MQVQLDQNKLKVQKVDKITAQNAELVTRKCALESSA
jgi:phage shock protein A